MGSSLLLSFIPPKHLLSAGSYGRYSPCSSKTPPPDHCLIKRGTPTSLPPATWYWPHLTHSQLKPLCSFHISQDFTVLILVYSLILDFLLFALYHTINTRAAIRRNFLKTSPTISLPSHINCFLFYFHLVPVRIRPSFHGCNKYGETILHSAFFTEK